MLKSLQGIYREGKIEFLEPVPIGLQGRVIVTFLETGTIELAQRGIDEQHAANLRHRLQAFNIDWQLPEMDVYDSL